MTPGRLLPLAVLGAALLAPAAAPAAAPYRSGEVLVRYRDGTTRTERAAAQRASATRLIETTGRQARRLRVRPGATVPATLAALRARPDVEYAVPDFIAHASAIFPNDPGAGATPGGWAALQWNFVGGGFGIDAPDGWQHAADAGAPGAQGVKIAVLDTGVAYRDAGRFRRSPDFGAGRFLRGYDFVDRDSRPYDHNGHGTHVASTIGEETGNGVGVTGIAYRARLMPVRVLDSRGEGEASVIARGIRFAVQHGADLINLSLEFPTSVGANEIPDIIDALRYAHRRGVTVVAASGNSLARSVAYPARAGHVISVGSVTERGCRSYFSNAGSGLDLVAPGGGPDAELGSDPRCHPYDEPGRNIFQMTYAHTRSVRRFGLPDDYEGTSMAAAHVTGIAALVIATKVLGPHPTPDALLRQLKRTATDLGAPGPDHDYGSGLVNASAATVAVAPSQ